MSTNAPEKTGPFDSASASSGSSSRRRIAAIVVLVVVALAVGLGAFAMFGPAPPVPQGMLTATADEDRAAGYRQEGEISGDAVIAVSVTKLKSNRNVTASTSTISSSGDRMFDRTLAIYNQNDDLLMQRIGLTLFEQLRDEGRFKQIRYLPAGEHLPYGDRLPEVFVTLDKTSWEESGLPGSRQFKGKLVVTASDQFRRSSNSYSTNLSPPQVQYRWRAEIDYTAKQTGIETSGARYQAVSRDLAKEIAGQLTKLLDDMVTKYGTASELPKQVYPEYTEPPPFDFVVELDAEKLVDGPQFMKHVVAVWQVPDDRTPREVIAAVSRSLADAGWKVPVGDEDREYLRATDGEQVVVVFRDNDGRGGAGENADTPTRMFVEYTRNMPADDIYSAVRKMFEDGADESALVMFQNAWYRHRDLVEEYFKEHTPTQAESWLQLARLRKKSEPEAARKALLRANALQRIIHQKLPDSPMKKLAEELGMDKFPQRISHEMMKILGLGELRKPGQIKVTVRENEPAAIWLGESGEEQSWLLLTPIRRRGVDPEWTLRIQLLKLRESGWSRSDQTGGDLRATGRPVHTQHVGNGQEVQVFSESVHGGRSYRLTLRRSGPENPH